MNLVQRIVTLTFAACLLSQLPAYAADAAFLYLVHGVPGRDIASTQEPNFPVDVLLNYESCYLRGFSFGAVNGPIVLPPGQYNIKISPADALAPCSNTPIVDTTVDLASGQDLSAVLALKGSDVATIVTYPNRFQPVAAGKTRLAINYAGTGSAIDFLVTPIGSKTGKTYVVQPGASVSILLPAGGYTIQANVKGTTLAGETLELSQQSVTELFAVGKTGNQTIILVNRTTGKVI